MVRHLREIARLSRSECLALGQAAFFLLLSRAALRVLPVIRLVPWARRRRARPSAPDTERLLALLEIAARRLPGPTCLERAVAAQWLLARHGVAAAVHIGVARGDGGLTAHAWVEREGASNTAETAAYTSLAVLGGG